MRGEKLTPYWFVAPAAIMLAVILGFPAVTAILESAGLGGKAGFPDFRAYGRLLADPQFGATAVNTILFVGCVVAMHVVIGMAIALLLNLDMPGRWLFRVVAILPWTMPDVIGGLIFRFIFDTLSGGLNAVLLRTGLATQPFDWLGHPHWSMFAVIMAEIWRGYPYVMLILLAGLQAVPRDQYEAAAIDGAGRIRTFVSITLPNLRTVLIIAVVLDVVWETRLFGMVYGMTGGGPGYATQNLTLFVYKNYFQFFETTYASSIAVVLAAVLLAAAMPYLRLTLRRQD